jgi:hypothetical protein
MKKTRIQKFIIFFIATMCFMKTYLLVLLTTLFLFSCYPARYVHAPLIISGIEKKGDHTISGSFSTTTDTKNFNINGSYAISNHLIVQSSYTNRDDYSTENYNYTTQGGALDFAIGYTNNSIKKRFYVESFLGYGFGEVNNTNLESTSSYANFKYDKIFSQFNFNLKLNTDLSKSNYFSLHFPIRLEYLNYNKIAFSNFGRNSLEYLSENPTIFVFSIGKTLSYNLENATVSLLGTYHSPTTAVSFFTFGNAYIGFGVSWRNFLKKKKRTN